MNIVYASNDGYARHLGTSLYSLLDRNQLEQEIVIYLLSVGMSLENQEKLRTIASRFDRRLEVIEMGNLKERFPYEIDTGGFDISAMGRLFVGTVLPDTVERVLYLDCDTVVLSSLRGLWNTDLGKNVMGAVMEPTIYPSIKEQIGLKPEDAYFNSGVLFIDVKKWREQKAEIQLLEFYKKLGGATFACDQDTLNGALKGKIKPLSPRYNFFTNYRYFHYSDLVFQSPAYKIVPKEVFQRAKKHPAIIHFMGDERPWKAGNRNHYRRAYERYLEKTPWRGFPKEKGQEWYMAAYHLMDYATFLCPPVRRYISRKYGMKAVESRAR